ncbi:hypothetical protein D047_0619B, partial [Vibrio parahaemolyticus VPTS-2010_2]
ESTESALSLPPATRITSGCRAIDSSG